MVKRLLVALFALGLLGSGCDDKGQGLKASDFVLGSDSVQILDARMVLTTDSGANTVGGMGLNYAVVRVHFTNNLSDQLFPVVSHFVFTSVQGGRYNGVDSGSTALIGISNDYGPMKKGDSRDLTIGFRVGMPQNGQITYEY